MLARFRLTVFRCLETAIIRLADRSSMPGGHRQKISMRFLTRCCRTTGRLAIEPLLAKPGQYVCCSRWPAMARSAGLRESGQVRARWCQSWVSACPGYADSVVADPLHSFSGKFLDLPGDLRDQG